MTAKTVEKMTDTGAASVLMEIGEGLKQFAVHNPETAKSILIDMIDTFLEPLAAEDAFGTEGWEIGLGVEE